MGDIGIHRRNLLLARLVGYHYFYLSRAPHAAQRIHKPLLKIVLLNRLRLLRTLLLLFSSVCRQAEQQVQPLSAMAPQQLAAYDRWVAEANNASFASQATYDHWVPAFEALFAQQGSDWKRFYAAVQALADLPQPLREERLRALQPQSPLPAPAPAPAPAAEPA